MKVEIGRENGKYAALLITEQGPALSQKFDDRSGLITYLRKEKERARASGELLKVVRKPTQLKLL